jgi:uncharacterized repeat protein (TIGR04002 family)
MKKPKYYTYVLTALFTALVFVLTYFVKIPQPLGYIHLGDAAIYLAAAFLPTPYALFAAGVGGALSDFVGEYMVFVPVTFIVKVLLALCFTAKKEKILNVRNIIAPIVCCGITVFGYFAFEIFYYGVSAYAEMIPNLIQAVGSAVAYYVIAAAFDGVKVTSKLKAI